MTTLSLTKPKKPMPAVVKTYLNARKKALRTGSPLLLPPTPANPPAKPKRMGSTNLGKLTASKAITVNGVYIPFTPEPDNRIKKTLRPKNVRECFQQMCADASDTSILLQFFPYKVKLTYTKEKELRAMYNDLIDFDQDTLRLFKGKHSYLYFRYENDAILIKLAR